MASVWRLAVLLAVFFTVAYGSVNFIAIGDWGADPFRTADTSYDDPDENDPDAAPYGVDDQRRVADRMDQWAGENGCDFVLALADNFYPDGLESMDDPRFDLSWRYMYNGTSLADVVWYPSLGNHDHFLENAYYQVNMTQFEPRWQMPYFWYDRYVEKDGVKVHFVTLDTELLSFNWFNESAELNREAQLEWFRDVMANAEPSDWTVVYGHHPLRSCGRYGPRGNYLNSYIYDILISNNVDLYLSGHDHNLQHIVDNSSLEMDYVVSGGGGRGRYELRPFFCETLNEDGYTSRYFGERYGFVAFEVTLEEIRGRFYGDQLIDGQLEEVYSFTRTRSQQVRAAEYRAGQDDDWGL